MLKKNKILVLCAVFACSLVLAAGCAGKDGSDTVNRKPSYPLIDYNTSVGADSSVLNMDESGLFSTGLGITQVSYNKDIPQKYAELEDYSTPKKGVRFDANISGAQIYFNRVLDLNYIQDEIVTFEVLHGEDSQISAVEAELIDIYDSSKRVKVSWSYISAPTVSDTVVSCNSVSAAGNNTSNDDFGKLRLQYGATNYLSNLFEEILGWYGNGHEHRPFHFKYINDKNEVRADVGAPANQKDFLLLDTDNPIHMGDDVFEGFTTGEVYLRLTLADISGKGSIVVTSVGGSDLSGEAFTLEPSNAIKVKFDNPAYAEKMPEGKKGEAYPVPEADSKDIIRGEFNVNRMVVAPDGSAVKIENGKFVPASTGVYNLVYSAKDINGFVISEKYPITVKEELSPLAISATRTAEDILALKDETLPVPVITGGSGTAETSVLYYFNDKQISPDILGNYVFDCAGTLKMQVKATDYLGNKAEKSFDFTIKNNPVLKLLGSMPNGLKAGSDFVAPDFTVECGGQDYSAKEIYADGVKLGADRKIKVPSSGSVKLVYYAAKGTAKEISSSYDIPVYAAMTGADASDMFITSGSATATQAEGGVALNASNMNNGITFANPVSAMMTELYFRDTEHTRFEYFEVTLSDSLNPAVKVSFRVYNNPVLTENFRVQNQFGSYDEFKYGISSTVSTTERKHFYYDNSDHCVYNVNLIKIAEIKYRTDGKVFNGFESGILNVSVKFGNVKGSSGILVLKLGNQLFDTNSLSFGDLIPPQLAPAGKLRYGKIEINSDFTVPAVSAVDVLSLGAYVSVSFTSPDKVSLLKEDDGSEAKTFKLDKLGNYTLVYRVEDVNGVIYNWSYTVTVIDNTSPVITESGTYQKEYRRGDKITFADITASDDVDKKEDIYVYVVMVSSEYAYTKHLPGEEYTFEAEGLYRLQCCARDSSGNYAVVEYLINVY